jgi:ketosteroid isomerase-like protein
VSAASLAHIEARRANDLAGIGSHMAPNVVVSGTGELDVRGAAAAMAGWDALLTAMPITRLDVRPDPLLVSGDLALEAGDFDEVLTPVDGSEPVLIEGRYAFVWQRQGGGEWRITRFITLDRMTDN